MKRKLAEPGVHTILASWEHANIVSLALALGAHDCDAAVASDRASPCHDLVWPSTNFDTIWALHFDAAGRRFLGIDTTLMHWKLQRNQREELENCNIKVRARGGGGCGQGTYFLRHVATSLRP